MFETIWIFYSFQGNCFPLWQTLLVICFCCKCLQHSVALLPSTLNVELRCVENLPLFGKLSLNVGASPFIAWHVRLLRNTCVYCVTRAIIALHVRFMQHLFTPTPHGIFTCFHEASLTLFVLCSCARCGCPCWPSASPRPTPRGAPLPRGCQVRSRLAVARCRYCEKIFVLTAFLCNMEIIQICKKCRWHPSGRSVTCAVGKSIIFICSQ